MPININAEKAQLALLNQVPEKMKEIFEAALTNLGETVGPEARNSLYALEAVIEKAILRQDWEAVKTAVKSATVPPEAEAEKQNILNLLNQ